MSTHFDYEASAIHSVYDEARRLPPETLRIWVDAVARFAPPTDVRVMLDIGCGTGRFLEPLARGLRAQALGLDRSLKMLGEARAKLLSGDTGLTCASAEALPVRTGCVDLVFLSMVYHHLADRDAALRESRRVLRPAGHLLVRTATAERLDSHLWLRFFPAARPIEVARTPSTAELVTRAGSQGLTLCHHVVIRQPFAPEPVVYAEKIGLRGISSLAMLADDVFEAGIAALRAHCQSQEGGRPIWEAIDLFHFVPTAATGP